MKTNHQSHQFQSELSLRITARQLCLILTLASLPLWPAGAAQLKEARVTQVIQDVKLLPKQAAPRPAAVSDQVREGTAVRTGVESRAELTFTDQTLARLGANTIFSFDQGTRNLELGGGAMLLRVPKNAGGAQINTAAITAAITGTTMLLEYHPDAYCKFMMLEGVARIFRNNRVGESVLLHPGQMLIVNPKGTGLPDPVDFDLKRVTETSALVLMGPLPSGDLIARERSVQDTMKNEGGLVETNLVIFGSGTAVTLLDPTNTAIINQANSNEERQSIINPTPTATVTPTPTSTMTPTPTVPPPPDKFGTPSVIASSTPYVISSGTVIQTDPAITTNDRTDPGKIYRDEEEDGPLSTWLFGSTSLFDQAISFDQLSNLNLVPLAAFKFSALNLTGNPTIVFGEGGATSLALVSVGDLISGPPGGALTFTGLQFLLIATQNGSITLTSDLSFENIPNLLIYARGFTSNLILDSAISGTFNLGLASEGSIQVTDSLVVEQTNDFGLPTGLSILLNAGNLINVGGDLSLTTDASGVVAGGIISVISGGDTTIGGLFGLTVNGTSGNVGNGGNIDVLTGGDLTVGSLNFTLDYNNDAVSITNGGNIDLTVGGTLQSTAGGVSLLILTPIANTLTNGGNLDLTVGGDLDTGENPLDLTVVTTEATQVGTGANLTATIGGDVLTGAVTAQVNNDTSGQIGTGGNVSLNVTGNLTASSLLVQLTNAGGNVDLGGNLTLAVGGNLTDGDLTLTIANNPGGHIGTGGNIFLSTGGDLNVNSINALINNRDGGTIDNGSNLTFDIGGALTVSADASLVTTTRNDGLGGGVIGSDVLLNLNAASVSTGGFIDLAISANAGGDIQSATLNFIVPGDLSATGGIFSEIQSTGFNVFGGPFIAGGMINGDAVLNLNFGGVSSGDVFDIEIDNNGAGTISGNALMNIAATGSLTAQTDIFNDIINTADLDGETVVPGGTINGSASVNVAVGGDIVATGLGEFAVLNNDFRALAAGGTIVGDGTVVVTANGISTGDFFQPLVNDRNGSIGGSAIVSVAVTNDISVGTATLFTILNATGDIGADALGDLTASNLTSGSTFNFQILNDSGSIGGNALLTANLSGGLTSVGDAFTQITNGAGAIGGDATIDITAATSSVGGTLEAFINNTGGSIGGSATINMNVSGDATATNDTTFEILGSDAAAAAAININGGNYDSGGTFLTFIDGDGAITFTNAIVHADVLKVGALGTNGVLTIGGGSLSGDTLLKLYASGSNGTINFISNVSLSSNSSVIIAGNTVTINNGIVVTITGDDGVQASVFTNVPNYTGSGGNASTTGAFAGNGATTQPLDAAPPFDDGANSTAAAATTSAASAGSDAPAIPSLPQSSGKGGGRSILGGKGRAMIARVANTDELLDLVDRVTSAPVEKTLSSSSSRPRSAHNPRTGSPSHGSPRVSPASSLKSIPSRTEGSRATGAL